MTIAGADDLKVFGGHQFGIPDEKTGMAEVTITKRSQWGGGSQTETYSVVYDYMLRANASIGDYINPALLDLYVGPNNSTHHDYSGGAGIGGGPSLVTDRSGTSSFNGVAGNIIINGGMNDAAYDLVKNKIQYILEKEVTHESV